MNEASTENKIPAELEEGVSRSEANEVRDDAERDDTVTPVQYDIVSFGADMDAEGLVKRLQREDVFVPPFQRDYVWTLKEASRFIESLLLGLPVPGIFLARESDSKKLLVIDGQQRLKTLMFFFEGVFNPDPDATTKRVFRLQNVQQQFEGRTYETLDEDDRIALNDSIIHATIVKQDSPDGEQNSVYHIFERLNTSGRKLSRQQIRVAIYHGDFIDLIHELNDNESWRAIFGRKSRTLKDEEMILRFLALFFDRKNYKRPMERFLNDFTSKVKAGKGGDPSIEQCRALFEKTILVAHSAFDDRAFRIEKALNVAVFDSVMVGIAESLRNAPELPPEKFKEACDRLFGDRRYLELVSRATADEKNVEERISLSVATFADIQG